MSPVSDIYYIILYNISVLDFQLHTFQQTLCCSAGLEAEWRSYQTWGYTELGGCCWGWGCCCSSRCCHSCCSGCSVGPPPPSGSPWMGSLETETQQEQGAALNNTHILLSKTVNAASQVLRWSCDRGDCWSPDRKLVLPASGFCLRRQKGESRLSRFSRRMRSCSSSSSRRRRRKFIRNWKRRGPSTKWCLLVTGGVEERRRGGWKVSQWCWSMHKAAICSEIHTTSMNTFYLIYKFLKHLIIIYTYYIN